MAEKERKEALLRKASEAIAQVIGFGFVIGDVRLSDLSWDFLRSPLRENISSVSDVIALDFCS